MTPDQLGQELPDEIRMIVWARKEKHGIDGCCFGVTAIEEICFEPRESREQVSGRLSYWPGVLLLTLYIAIGIYKLK